MSNINQIKGIILAIGHKGDNTPLEEEYLNLYKENKFKVDSTLLDEINRLAKKNKDNHMRVLSANANKELLKLSIDRGIALYNKDKDGRLHVEPRESSREPNPREPSSREPSSKKSRLRSFFTRIFRKKRKGGRTRKILKKKQKRFKLN